MFKAHPTFQMHRAFNVGDALGNHSEPFTDIGRHTGHNVIEKIWFFQAKGLDLVGGYLPDRRPGTRESAAGMGHITQKRVFADHFTGPQYRVPFRGTVQTAHDFHFPVDNDTAPSTRGGLVKQPFFGLIGMLLPMVNKNLQLGFINTHPFGCTFENLINFIHDQYASLSLKNLAITHLFCHNQGRFTRK